MSKKTANLLCLLVAAVWGGGFLATASALNTFDPFTVLMIRFTGSAIISWLMVLIQRKHMTKEAIFRGSVSGVFLYLAFMFQTFGLAHTSTGMNSFLTTVNVVLVPYIAWLIFKKKPKRIQLLASFICLLGIGCLSLSNGQVSFNFGDFMSLMCAVFFAMHIVSLEWSTQHSDTVCINAIQMSVAAIIAMPFAFIFETLPSTISMNAILSCVYMICIATWLAFQMQTTAQKYTDASSASLLLGTESLFANLFGYLLLHEEKTPIMLFGGLLIFIAVVMVESSDIFKPKTVVNLLKK